MEIRTTTRERQGTAEPAPTAEKGRYLRRPPQQKVRKTPGARPLIVRGLRFAGKVLVLLLAVALTASLFVFTTSSSRLELKHVSFQGCNRSDPKALEQIIRAEFPSQILRIDLKSVRARLEQEPWVRRAELRRMLPSDLIVYVDERVPAGILELGGELMIADDEGVLLDRYDQKLGRLNVPVFKGTLGDNPESYRMYQQENSERVRLGLKLVAELESGSSAFTEQISEVDLSDKTNVKILLVNESAEIYIGDHDFLKRFRTLMSNMAQYREIKNKYTEISSVDLRYPGQIVYRPRQAESAQAQP